MKIKIRHIAEAADEGVDFCAITSLKDLDAVVQYVKLNSFYHALTGDILPYFDHQLCFDDTEAWCEIIVGKE